MQPGNIQLLQNIEVLRNDNRRRAKRGEKFFGCCIVALLRDFEKKVNETCNTPPRRSFSWLRETQCASDRLSSHDSIVFLVLRQVTEIKREI